MTIPEEASPLGRFRRSMARGLEEWREGIGYDLAALAEASPEERLTIEQLLLHRSPLTWCDIEALATLDTPGARDALRRAALDPDPMIQVAVSRFAPRLIGEEARTAALIQGIAHGTIYGGLTATLLEVEAFHPSAVLEALWRGTSEREGEVAMHLAAMLLFLHGLAPEPFDWEQRPFLLRFHTEHRTARAAAVAELQARIAQRVGGLEHPPASPSTPAE
ncbi:MAG: hypothetical protein KJZ47_12965 [Gemmatimonadales bacterium]|nr:hypothetical protein [Gemmatimonadales bacterium]